MSLIEHVTEQLRGPAVGKCLHVAYSGGLDSHVLLHVLSRLASQLQAVVRAIHVNHGIHPEAANWENHCRSVAAALDIPLQIHRVDAGARTGESPESLARQLRYQCFAGLIATDDMLVTAHHRQDQAETLLLQLLRGSGPAGLAAMPVWRPFAGGVHARPLLALDRDVLVAYARQQQLHWIDDSSNASLDYDRNYLRHRIMPLLSERWPGAVTALVRAAAHQADAYELLAVLADLDLPACFDPVTGALRIPAVRALDPARRRNVLRRWLQGLRLPTPSTVQMQHIEMDVIAAGDDADPCVRWSGAEVRRYRDGLYAFPPLVVHDPQWVEVWDLEQPCVLPLGTLQATLSVGPGLRPDCCPGGQVEIRFRQGGERLQPEGRQHRRLLKKLFQEHGVPTWMRERIPLIFAAGRLVQVPGFWIEDAAAAAAGETAWHIVWRPVAPVGDEVAP